jgi:hypothetical protein
MRVLRALRPAPSDVVGRARRCAAFDVTSVLFNDSVASSCAMSHFLFSRPSLGHFYADFFIDPVTASNVTFDFALFPPSPKFGASLVRSCVLYGRSLSLSLLSCQNDDWSSFLVYTFSLSVELKREQKKFDRLVHARKVGRYRARLFRRVGRLERTEVLIRQCVC